MNAAVAAIVLAWVLGVLGVSALWPRTRSWRLDFPAILFLGLGFGLALASVIFFGATQLFAEPVLKAAALELLIAMGLGAWLWRRPARPNERRFEAPSHSHPVLSWVAASIFAQAVVIAAIACARAYGAEPLGSWDGWAIWNMHARFIFRGGENWAHLLVQPQVGWTHPDYPLLVPASVARLWAWVGRDEPYASGLLSAMFGIATVGVLVSAVARLRHRFVAFAGGMVLLGTPFFVRFSSNEHADIPLGFFLLATVALIALSRDEPEAAGLPALAGFAAGMAAWTKNEGLMFALLAGLAWGIYALARGSRRGLGAFFGGLAFALVPLIYFKTVLAPGNDVVSGQIAERLGRLLEWPRHTLILKAVWRDATRFGEWSFVPFFAMMLPLLGPGWRRLNGREWIAAAVVGLMLIGYYGVYLVTPWDLAWHLDSSLVRLLLQLWPAAIFFWCLAVTFVEPSAGSTSPATLARPIFARRALLVGVVMANLVVAGMVVAAFARQRAPNEFDVVRAGGGHVSALIGEGWFGRETDGRSVWAWSQGRSTLLMVVNAPRGTKKITLRFGVRSLGERTVEAKIGERVVWRARVGGQLQRAEIAGLLLPPGLTTLVFASEERGVPESANPTARTLSFSLYDVRVTVD